MSARDIIGLQFGRTFGTESVDIDLNIGNDAVTSDADDTPSVQEEAIEQMDSDDLEMEGQEIETETDEQDIEETNEEIEESENDIESLEAIQYALELSLSKGGLDSCGMEAFQIATDEILSKYGVKSPQAIGIPSMEAYRADPHQATVISLEKVKDTLVTIKNGIIEFLKKLWFKIKQAVHNIFNLGFSIEKKAKKLQERAKKVKDNSDAPDKVTVYQANKFKDKNSTCDFNFVKKGLDKLSTMFTGEWKAYLEIPTDANDYDDLMKRVNVSQQEYDLVFRGAKAVAEYSHSMDTVKDQPKSTKFKLGYKIHTADIDASKSGEAYSLPTLSISQCNNILTEIINVNKKVDEIHSKVSRKSQLSAKWADFKDERNKDDKTERYLLQIVNKAVRMSMNMTRAILKFAVSALRGLLDYVQTSIKAHEKGGKKDDKKDGDKGKTASTESFTLSRYFD